MAYKYIDRKFQIIKSFYTGIGKSSVLFPTSFLVALGHGIVTLGVIFYIREVFSATPSQVGYFTALWSLCYVAGCLFLRPLTNLVLPRYALMCATFLKSIFIVMIVLAKDITYAYIFYGFFGLSIVFFWPPLMGWLSHGVEGAQLGKLISKFNFSWSIGSIISPLLAGFLSQKNPVFPLYAGVALFLSAGLLLAGASLTLPKIRLDKVVNLKKESSISGKDNSTPMRFPAWFGIFTTYTVIGIIVNIFPLFALDQIHMDKSTIGFLLQGRALFATFGFIVMGRTTFWHFRPAPMLLSQCALAVCVFLLRFISSVPSLGVVLGFMGLFMAFNYFNSLFHGVSGSINRSGRMAVHESLISSGLIVGSAVGGVLYQKFSMPLVYSFCTGFLLFGLLVQGFLSWWFMRKKIEKQPSRTA